ncbi:MAG TPA: serine dehydratase subunit alpha family protein, partial [Elusimicrobia bacterium]|nr:serine dehydratase subunit alpha family protein [Elusimicrobiota bacterium]
MSLLKEVLKYEVNPAMGCTEPVAVAFCAASAAELLGRGRILKAEISTDPGIYKNGLAVALPNTKGEKGNLLAAALGTLIREPGLKTEIFRKVTPETLRAAKALIKSGRIKLSVDHSRRGIYVKASLKTAGHKAVCVLSGGHGNIVLLKKDGKTVFRGVPVAARAGASGAGAKSGRDAYKNLLRKADFSRLFKEAEKADAADLAYIKQGIEFNLKASREGLKLKKVGYYIQDLIKKGYLKKDILSTAKLTTSAATDARMAGAAVKVMSSGGSGNQGVVAILVPYLVGKAFRIREPRVLKSIALSHLVNSYIKVFTGELAPICGCAVAAGVGASVAIVYQLKGVDLKAAGRAVNTVISDIGGMLCDGA